MTDYCDLRSGCNLTPGRYAQLRIAPRNPISARGCVNGLFIFPGQAARMTETPLFATPTRVRRLQIEITTDCNLRCAGCQRTLGMAAGT